MKYLDLMQSYGIKFLKHLFISLVFLTFLSCQKSPEKKNVIFILIDTLRSDHLSINRYERNTTPNIDNFAKESINFSNAFSPASWTPMVMASLFTGLYPSIHGMIPPDNFIKALNLSYKLPEKLYTLSELYKDNGFRTIGIQTNPWIDKPYGYAQGFDKFFYKKNMKAGRVNKKAYHFLNKYNKGKKKKPFFLYLHYLDPHEPYNAPSEYSEIYKENIKYGNYDKNAQELLRQYDREIKYTDDKLGELFSYLKKNKFYDNSIIIVMADHGQQFYERGLHGHGNFLFNEEIKVPFFIRTDGKGKIIDTPVSTLDLFETLVSLSSLKNEKSQTQGFSLVTEEGLNKRKRTCILSEIKRNTMQKAIINNKARKSIFDYDLNTKDMDIEKSKATNQRIFDLKKDLLEQNPINDDVLKNRLNKDFLTLYHKLLKSKVTADEKEKIIMKDKTIKELKSLGYM